MQINESWNAEPNAPEPVVRPEGEDVVLEFYLNPFIYPNFKEDEKGFLRFRSASKYRLGPTNDEGWYRGQCRYGKVAPAWGQFYELQGCDSLIDLPNDWHTVTTADPGSQRHFLFYFRDHTFEALADAWVFDSNPQNALLRAA